MLIIYIDETKVLKEDRFYRMFHSLPIENIKQHRRHQTIEMISGLKILFLSKKELDRVRGTEPKAIFIFADLKPRDREWLNTLTRRNSS